MTLRVAAAAAAFVLLAAPAAVGQSGRTLEAFVVEANRIPLNPTALLSPTARRLGREVNAGFEAVSARMKRDKAAGRTPAACPPETMQLNPKQLRDFLNGIPRARRLQMTVPDGLLAWMADRYPCPG